MALKSIKLENLAARAILIAAGFFLFVCAFFFVRWYFADSIAAHTEMMAVADFAVALSPDDPQARFTVAALTGKIFAADNLDKSLAEYEKAVTLAPNDFRYWLAFGTARERTGDRAGAELALRKALMLAPNYSYVKWTLGNVLLRRGKIAEGFDEMRQAAESDTTFVNPMIVTAAQIAGENSAEMRQYVGNAPPTDAALAIFLARQKQFDEALQIWNQLPDEQRKTTFKEIGEQLYNEMLASKKFRDALRLRSQLDGTPAAVGQIANGGFEQEVNVKKPGVFEWQIADGGKPQILFDDTQKHGGNRSLVIVFNSPDGKDFRPISQTVAVESGQNYNFEFFYKSELKSPATLVWEIADAADGRILATTGAAAANADWANMRVGFNAGNAEAITVRLAREACKTTLCPITGKVWFDDFSLNH